MTGLRIETFSRDFEFRHTDPFPSVSCLEADLKIHLPGCSQVLRWAIVQISRSSQQTILRMEGAYVGQKPI